MKCLCFSVPFILINVTFALALPLLSEIEQQEEDWRYMENSLPDVSLSHKIKGLQKFFGLKTTADISPADLDTATERALNVWSSVTPLTFTRLDDGEADIMILFGSQHVFSLRHGSPETHFDADETWTMGFNRYNMFIVAAHEFGRALDLSHSAAPGALIFCLPLGDVNGIQALFVYFTFIYKTSNACKCDPNLSFDAVVGLQGEMMFFKDKLIPTNGLWHLKSQNQIAVRNWLPLFTHKIYSQFTLQYILYWAIDGYNILPGYPKYIHRWGIPKSTGKTLFFAGGKYWRYDSNIHMNIPPGITSRMDAAFECNGKFPLAFVKRY
uniref:Peptidase metallopeptidase domain-containing protein n=1 Tax=Callorhinchus milii TaxID=7868 RepID=A0A4W3H8S7_CALMI